MLYKIVKVLRSEQHKHLFKCHPKNMNFIRYWYKELIADFIDSKILQCVLNQLTPNPFQLFHNDEYRKELASMVRLDGNYAIT